MRPGQAPGAAADQRVLVVAGDGLADVRLQHLQPILGAVDVVQVLAHLLHVAGDLRDAVVVQPRDVGARVDAAE